MKPIPIDSGDFVEIRTARPQQLYVDKTAYFHQMITDPQARRFFLARPRRFGKSLMITTLKAIFQGRRDLFKGLAFSKRTRRLVDHCVVRYGRSSSSVRA